MKAMDAQMDLVKQQLNMLKECVRAIQAANPTGVPAIVDTFEQSEVDRWVQLLPTARVTRWGGMIRQV